MGAADDLAVELDHDRARVQAELPEQIRSRGGAGDASRLTIYQYLELSHRSLVQGKSMAIVAAAGSGAIQSPWIAATP
jgi:hypothetical protein